MSEHAGDGVSASSDLDQAQAALTPGARLNQPEQVERAAREAVSLEHNDRTHAPEANRVHEFDKGRAFDALRGSTRVLEELDLRVGVETNGSHVGQADHQPDARAAALELEIGWHMRSQDGTIEQLLAPTLGIRYAMSRSVEITLDWPFAFADVSPSMGSSQSTFRTGNPCAAFYYTQRSEDAYFRIGGAVAPPLASTGAELSGTPYVAYSRAAAMRGQWDIWLYLPDNFGLVIPARLETQRGSLVLGADFTGAVIVPTSSRDHKTDVSVQLAGLMGARIDKVTLGARLQGVWLPTIGGDNAQVALVPFVQADFSGGGFAYGRFVLNLDEPLGVYSGNIWGLYLGAGVRF